MPRKPAVRRAGRTPERREIDPFQPDHRLAPGDRRARSPGRRAIRSRGRSTGAASRSSCSTPAGCTAPARIRCTSSSCEQGQRAIAGADLARVRRRRTRRAGAGRRDDRRGAARDRAPGDARGQQDRRQARARRRRSDFYQLGFEPVARDFGRARPRRRAICSTRSSSARRSSRRQRASRERRRPAEPSRLRTGRPTKRDRRRHRRPAERRQVVAASTGCCKRSG